MPDGTGLEGLICRERGMGNVELYGRKRHGSTMNYTVKRLDDNEISHIYKTYMTQDFPRGELKPLSHIIRSVEKGYGFTLGIYDGQNLTGYAVFVFSEEGKCALLDYFAILKENRGKGAGHEAFRLLEAYFRENLPEIDGIYIEAERIDMAKDERERVTRSRRIAFYRSCDCKLTKLESKLFGVEYSILYRKLRDTEVYPSREALDTIYRTMFKKSHYKHFVTLGFAGDVD